MNTEGIGGLQLVALLISVLSPVGTVIAVAMAWQKLKDRSDENKRRIEKLESDGVCYEALATKLTALSTDIGWIKRDLDLYRRTNGGSGHSGSHGKGGQGHA